MTLAVTATGQVAWGCSASETLSRSEDGTATSSIAAFASATAPCTVTQGGRGAGRPGGYGASEGCTIAVAGGGVLGACPSFDTEASFDQLTIDGGVYEGTDCPQGVSVTGGSSIAWHSDSSVQASGWEICFP